jgi:opacity protein-like surface antigen
MLFYSIGVASPLMNYSAGKTSIDYTQYSNENIKDVWKVVNYGNTTEWHHPNNKSYSLGITTGLGNKWALQYRQFNTKMDFVGVGMKTQEVNVLHKMNEHLSAFVGWHQGKYTNDMATAENKDVFQAGLVGSMPIAPKTELFGVVGLGRDLVNYEAGVAYQIAKNLDVNVEYRYKKVRNLKDYMGGVNYQETIIAQGFGFGLTYSF